MHRSPFLSIYPPRGFASFNPRQRPETSSFNLKYGNSEAASSCPPPQAEAKSESERVRKDGKELAEKVRELEGQLEWVRSEREEEVQQLKADKKGLEQRAREAESQLAQIKSRKKDELKVRHHRKNVCCHWRNVRCDRRGRT